MPAHSGYDRSRNNTGGVTCTTELVWALWSSSFSFCSSCSNGQAVVSIGKSILLQAAGWMLVLVGLAALVLPGPGVLAIFAGMAVLATQYEWAERRIALVEKAAVQCAEASVKTLPRIVLSASGAFWLVGLGIYWGLGPAAPSWWPVAEKWWLAGGWGTGASLIASGVIALGLLAYSYLRFGAGRRTKT